MAISLVSEVVAYISTSDLNPGERLVLMAIAEQANKDTRQAWQEAGGNGKRRWILGEVVGVGPTGLRAIFQRLAKRGLEVRVPLGTDSSGRPVFAVYGRQTTYRLPVLVPTKRSEKARDGDTVVSPRGDTRKSPRGDTLVAAGDTLVSGGDTLVSPYPSVSRSSPNSNAREPRHIVIENTDAKPSEAEAVVARIAREINPRSLGGFLVHLARQGELQRWVDEARAATIETDQRAAEDADRKIRQRLPRCEHGTAGGDQPHSVTGELRCGACRTRHRASQLNNTARVIHLRTKEVS